MNFQKALLVIETIIYPKHLNKIERLVFQYSWEGWSYSKIALTINYDEGYVKDVGASLWRRLSKAFGQRVTKKNLKTILNLHLTKTQDTKNLQIIMLNK